MSLASQTMVAVSDTAISENELNNGTKPIYLHKLIALFLLIIVICTVQILIRSGAQESRFWPGWYIAVLPAGSDVQVLSAQLAGAGIDNLISSSNSSVDYMAIPDIRSVSIEDLDTVVLVGDPRRDEWLSSVSLLFQSGDGRDLIYLPAVRSIRFYEKLLDGIGLGSVEIADRSPTGGVSSVLLYLVSASGITLFIRKDRFSRSLLMTASLLWLPYVFFAPYAVLPFVLLVFTAGGLDHRGNLLRQAGGICSFFLALLPLILGFSFPGSIAVSIIPAVAALLVSVLMPASNHPTAVVGEKSRPVTSNMKTRPARRKLVLRKREHELFEPVSLTDSMNRHVRRNETQNPSRTGKISFMPLGALFLVVLVFSLLSIFSSGFRQDSGEGPVVPAIGEAVTDFESISGLHRLEEQHDAVSLPDSAQMLASRAYQESFLYGGSFRLPVPGEETILADYIESDGVLEQVDRIITTYDRAWYSNAIAEMSRSRIGSLLVSSGGPAGVTLVNSGSAFSGLMSFPVPIFYLIASLILAFILVVLPSRITFVSRGAYSPLSSVRRRAQAA